MYYNQIKVYLLSDDLIIVLEYFIPGGKTNQYFYKNILPMEKVLIDLHPLKKSGFRNTYGFWSMTFLSKFIDRLNKNVDRFTDH